MRIGSAHTRVWMLVALIGLATACTAHVASAAPGVQDQLTQKRAQQAAAQAELGQMQADLNDAVAQYVSVGNDIVRVRQQISEVTTELAQQSASLDQAQAELTSRTVEMYRGDQMSLVEALLTSTSIEDFVMRSHYLIFMSQRDAMLLRDVRLGEAENLYLQQSLSDREAQLQRLQTQADADRVRLTGSIAATQARAQQLGSDITQLLQPTSSSSGATYGGGSPSSSFDANSVITTANYHAATSMSAADIQSFLDSQPGTLKSYQAPDHTGQTKSAAQMIADAAAYWNINPKVILVTLQKEQSLLSLTHPSTSAYQWAMGAGKGDTYTTLKDAGFGNQIWVGAQKLHLDAQPYKPGVSLTIEGSTVRPTSDGTYAQWTYTPHFSGVMSFWMLYWRYFGDPNA